MSAATLDTAAVISSPDFREFRDRLCRFHCLDRHELADAGVGLTDMQWWRFRERPISFFLRAEDDVAARLWGLLQGRQAQEVRA